MLENFLALFGITVLYMLISVTVAWIFGSIVHFGRGSAFDPEIDERELHFDPMLEEIAERER